MKKLFQAQITIRVSEYMEGSRTEKTMRLVWADTEAEAEAKIKTEHEGGSQYGTLYTVENVGLIPALGEP
jgi:hypothetical protein